jgi:hypothetical protein
MTALEKSAVMEEKRLLPKWISCEDILMPVDGDKLLNM